MSWFKCFSDNEITKVSGLDAGKLSRLHTFELRGNKLTSTDGIYLPNLKNLFLVSILSTCKYYLFMTDTVSFPQEFERNLKTGLL